MSFWKRYPVFVWTIICLTSVFDPQVSTTNNVVRLVGLADRERRWALRGVSTALAAPYDPTGPPPSLGSLARAAAWRTNARREGREVYAAGLSVEILVQGDRTAT